MSASEPIASSNSGRSPAAALFVDQSAAMPLALRRTSGTIAMMKLEQIVHRDPDILGGTAVFRGTRVPIRSLFDYLEGGDTLDEFLRQFPSVRREQAIAVLDLACETLAADAPAA
jgi:uncharacterized protein (DUF433 family)